MLNSLMINRPSGKRATLAGIMKVRHRNEVLYSQWQTV